MTDLALEAPAVTETGRQRSWLPSAVLALVLACYVILAPILAPDSWHEVHLEQARQPPSTRHWFGTDNAGRDLFLRAALGLRISLLIASLCAVLSTLLGMLVGTLAAASGGWRDGVLMRLADATNALPHLLLGIVVVAFFPGSPVAIIASITLTHWPPVARIVRSVTLATHRMDHVDAAYLAGASRWAVVRRHLLPAAAGQGAVAMVLTLPHAIWHESTLSFLGFGLPPDRPSLGTLLEISRAEIFLGAWWTLALPALLLVATTLAVAGLATVLRQRLAPSTEGRLDQ